MRAVRSVEIMMIAHMTVALGGPVAATEDVARFWVESIAGCSLAAYRHSEQSDPEQQALYMCCTKLFRLVYTWRKNISGDLVRPVLVHLTQ